jgi:hypothetical protein
MPIKTSTRPPERFNNSFRKIVPLDPGEVCDWKRHFFFVLREVIGYLESQATKNEARYVWTQLSTIAKRCHNYNTPKKPYSRIAVAQAIAFLIEQGIIRRVDNYEVNGRPMLGFEVAPHDLCCHRVGNHCEFHVKAFRLLVDPQVRGKGELKGVKMRRNGEKSRNA